VNLSPDPGDNPILAAAIAGDADLIVSGDKKYMLALGEIEGGSHRDRACSSGSSARRI